MRFVCCINDGKSKPDLDAGLIEAASIQEALEKLGPGANVHLLSTPQTTLETIHHRTPS